MRTFVAVELPEELRTALVSGRDPLLDGVRGAHPVSAEALHVTVQFLGETPVRQVVALADELSRVADQERSWEAAVTHFKAAPSASRPRVIWACVADGNGRFRRLAQSVGEALRARGYPPEERIFTPHITVARMRSARADPRLAAAFVRRDNTSSPVALIGTLAVRGLTLFESILDPRGARYRPLFQAPFPSSDVSEFGLGDGEGVGPRGVPQGSHRTHRTRLGP